MVSAVPDILARIIERKQADAGFARLATATLERQAEANRTTRRDFSSALLARSPAIIAEIKKASPSKGLLSPKFDPPAIAAAYGQGGAAALSILTDEPFFKGSLADLQSARSATQLPALRKDFTLDEYDVLEAAAHSADAVLLIAAILPVSKLRRFRELAESLGIASLVEVHNAEELEAAKDSGARIIGVNNRNLHTFEVSLRVSLDLVERIPAGAIRVSESGIHSNRDLHTFASAGYHGFLVGEHLMTSGDPEAALRALLEPCS